MNVQHPLYDRELLLQGARRNAVLELWEVERCGSHSYGDTDYVSIHGMRPADWHAKGARLLGRTAVECTRDNLGDAIAKNVAAIVARRPPTTRHESALHDETMDFLTLPTTFWQLHTSHRHEIGLGATRRKGIVMSGSLVNSSAAMALVAIPSQVMWSYFVGAVVLAAGLITIGLRGGWQKARGLDKLILLGPLFYGAPLAAFGTEHFTLTEAIASIIPAWIPWHPFWAYFVGACFIAAALSLVTRIQARLSASLLALTFFLFVALMDIPAWIQNPRDRFALTLALRELAFSGGPLALAASLTGQSRARSKHILAAIARYFIAIPVLFFSLEQFLHGKYVPGIPLDRLTPEWIYGYAIWTYLTAVVYAVAGILLLIGKKTRAAATWVGLTVLFVELVVYVPIAVVERASLVGFNYAADTLMFCGAVLLLAGAMPRDA